MTEWKYKWNDQEVDEETYKKLEKEHLQYVEDLRKKEQDELKKEKKK